MNWDSHAAVLFIEEPPPPIKRNCQWLPVNLLLFPIEQQTGSSVRPHAHGNVRNAAISSFLENKRSCWSTRLVPPHIPRAVLPDRSLLCVGPVSPVTDLRYHFWWQSSSKIWRKLDFLPFLPEEYTAITPATCKKQVWDTCKPGIYTIYAL